MVSVVDPEPRSFDRLGLLFSGRTVVGEGLDRDALIRAGVETADALAAVTSSDNVNVVVARIAQEVFHVKRVATRVYNPRRLPIYEQLHLQTVSSSTWGAKRLEQLLIHPALQNLLSAGNGDISVYEMTIPPEWAERKVMELIPADQAIAISVSRGSTSFLPNPEMVLKAQDILQVSATRDGMNLLRERMHDQGLPVTSPY
jgi:trk system potassium uptake protein TrkA